MFRNFRKHKELMLTILLSRNPITNELDNTKGDANNAITITTIFKEKIEKINLFHKPS